MDSSADEDRAASRNPGAGARLWSLNEEELLAFLGTSRRGLPDSEAARRLRLYGPNVLPEPSRRPLILRFLGQMTHFMALLLWLAGGLAFLSRTPELGWAIWAVILVNATFSFWQEYRAERALAELKKSLPAQARVVRNGVPRLVAAAELVPGDLIELEEGDRVPADARLLEAAEMQLDLSALTGESLPAPRRAGPETGPVLHPPEAANLVFAGTSVAAGRGIGVVYATGGQTEFGRVVRLTVGVAREPSTLERQVAQVVRLITAIAVTMGGLVFAVSRLLVGMGWRESFVFAIGIIVANVPEGLLPTLTLALALGVQRMARQKALVRRLSAVETLSAATVICTDKTGTLTRNELEVREIWVSGRLVKEDELCASPVSASSPFAPPGSDPGPILQARLLLAAAVLCSNARLLSGDGAGGERAFGDPTEVALLRAARRAGLDPEALRWDFPRRREIPFEARRRRMTVAVSIPAGPAAEPSPDGSPPLPFGYPAPSPSRGAWPLPGLYPVRGGPAAAAAPSGSGVLVCTKGAPEEVLSLCTFFLERAKVRELTPEDRSRIGEAAAALAEEGLRLLGVAVRVAGNEVAEADAGSLEREMIFLGLAAMMDPPRPEVAPALAACRAAGITVTVVTGDDGRTAAAVARQIGLAAGKPTVVTGQELDRLTDAELDALLARREPLIFARTTPEHKLRIVQRYKALGHVVAVTGDGVNDAPALHAAHVGVAMGIRGTDAAREAADIVLADDNFSTIVAAVREGRTVYRNLRKFITYILASNVPEIVPFLALAVTGIPPALNILQILAVDLGTDLLPALALGADPPEADVMETPPRALDRPLIDLPLLARAYGFLGLLEAAAAMLSFLAVWQAAGHAISLLPSLTPSLLSGEAGPGITLLYRQATTLTLAAIVAGQVGNVFACRSEREAVFRLGFFTNRLIWWVLSAEVAVLAALMYIPSLGRVFGTAPPPPALLPLLFLWPFLLLWAEEARKLAVRRRHKGRRCDGGGAGAGGAA